MLNLWLDPDDIIQDDDNVGVNNDALPRPKRTVSDHFRPAAAKSDAKKTEDVPAASEAAAVIELSDDNDGGDGIDDAIVPPADDEDALVPDNDVNSDLEQADGDDDEWPRYMNACFDGDCKYRLVHQVEYLFLFYSQCESLSTLVRSSIYCHVKMY